MAKPVGAACNLRCSYCYYLERTEHSAPMTERVLEEYIRQNLAAHGRDAEVVFAWHGGEPTLRGLEFFKAAVELQHLYGPGRRIANVIQTNGTLLDDSWCRFFRENNFLVGISIDGPLELHDAYRKYPDGRGSFDDAMNGLNLLREHGVAYDTLTALHARNAPHPREVYAFLRAHSEHIHILPVVETKNPGVPPGLHTPGVAGTTATDMAGFSVSADLFGKFLIGVFDAWRERDIGKRFVQTFEATIGNMQEQPAGLCTMEPVCGHCASMETDGSLYGCDRYTYAAYRLGNILETPLAELMERNRAFGMYKADGLAGECLKCRYLGLCWGGCPKDRYEGRNYLCQGFRAFFAHAERRIRITACDNRDSSCGF